MNLGKVGKTLFITGYAVGVASGAIALHSIYMRNQLEAESSIDSGVEEQKQTYLTRQRYAGIGGFGLAGLLFFGSGVCARYEERRQWEKVADLCDKILSMRDQSEKEYKNKENLENKQ